MEFGELASNLLMLNMRKSSRQTFMMIGSLGILKLALQCYTSVVDQGWAFLKQPVLQLARFGLDDLAERSGKIVIEDLESDSAIDLVGTSVLALHKLSSGSPSPTNHRHQIRIEQWFKEISSYHEIKPSPEESHKIVTRAGTMMFPSIMNNRVLSDFVDNLIEAPYGAQSDHRYDNAHIEPNSTFNINSSSYMSKQSDRVSTADSLSSYPSQFPDEVNNHETSSADSADYEHAKKHLVNQIGSRDSYLDDRQIKGPGSYSGSDTGASNYVPSILLPTENVDVAPNAKSPVTSGPGGEGGRHIGGRIGGRTSRIVHNSTLEGELDLSLTGKAIDPSMKKSDFNSSFGWESQQLQSGETLELKEYAFKDASVDHSKLRTLKQKKLSFSKSSNSKTRPNENNTEDNKVSDRVVNTSDGTRSIAYQDLDYEKSSFDSPNNGFYTPNVVAKYNNDGKRMQELRMQDRTPPRARGRRSRVLSKDNLASETSSVENDDLEDMTDSISVISYHSATSAVSTRERSTDGGHYASYKNSQGENNTTVKIPRKLLGAGSKQNSMNRAPAIPENGSPGTSTEALNYDFGGKGKLDMRLASCDSYDSTATSPAKSSRSLHNTPKRLISKRFSTGSSTSTPTNESMDQLLLSPRAPSPFDFSTSETPITPLTSSHRKSSRRSLQLNTSIEDTNSSSTSHDPISPRSKSDNFDYLAAEDMLPCHNPTQELSKALHGLENHEWPDIFHTITSVRKISIHHQVVLLDSGSLHSVVRLLNKQADNLRSQVVKNALLAVGELFNNLGKHMDVEINTLIGVILKVSNNQLFLVVNILFL